MRQRREPTSTSSFGVGRRESHDASRFYARFSLPHISTDEDLELNPAEALDRIYCLDSRKMDEVADSSVALVVTSPPYFAGKEYEESAGRSHVPATYVEYLEMLYEIFSECTRKLEPGGRIAVNVANLGRKPYRSLASDVIFILQDRLGLLLRGEIVWMKGRGASGSCAWGSFRSPANPVLRDMTERIVVASKGRFDRAVSRRQRAARALPSEASIGKDEFLDATTDVWQIPPESAKRVGHPAPFPVEIPKRLIELYTYRGDVVLDPLIGAGSAAVAAVQTERRFIGYDTDPGYVEAAEKRIAEAKSTAAASGAHEDEGSLVHLQAARAGGSAMEIARALLHDAGFVDVTERPSLPRGLELSFAASDRSGGRWYFELSGVMAAGKSGLRNTENVWKTLGKAAVLKSELGEAARLVLLTTELPSRASSAAAALAAVKGELYVDVLDVRSSRAHEQLGRRAAGDGS